MSIVYNILKDSVRLVIMFFRRPDPVEVLEKRKVWKSEFEKRLPKLDHAPTYGEAIIRDISRMDSYPDIDDKKKGISPWFNVEIKGFYHRGLEVFLRIEYLKQIEREWRYSNHNEEGAKFCYLVGRIPYDVIKNVDWDGDEYYNRPHIYCKFMKKNRVPFIGSKREPYEELIYYTKQGVQGNEYFSELVRYDDVLKA